MSIVLLSVVLGMAASMSTNVLRYRASIDRRRATTEAANNLLEIAMSLPYDQVDTATLEALAVDLNGDLDAAKWTIQVTESNFAQSTKDEPAGEILHSKKVSVLLASEVASKSPQLSRTPLVAWCYPFAEAVDEPTKQQSQEQETQP